MVKSALAAVAIAFVCSAVTEARVTRIEIVKVERVDPPSPGARSAIPPYERLSGKFYGELDPADPKNALITDIQLAARNARGKVEYVGTFSLMKPIDLSKASGVLMYSVVNRGNGTAAASAEGHISLVSGWQGDVVPTATNQTIQVPRAKNPDGSSITGPLVIRILGQSGTTARLMIPRGTPSPYPPATLDTTKATLVSAVSESAEGVKAGVVKIASADWAFATCENTPFPGTPDPAHICLKSGFDPSLLYELQYTVKDPLVLGIGFAATRDLNSFFRYEKKDDAGTPNPVAGVVRWAISEGSSQSGTFLRAFIRLGFNQDETGRIVWEGSNPNIAARVIDMNRRFALPGGDVGILRAWYRSAGLVGRLERRAAGTRDIRPARSLPRHEHVPEDHGNVRQRRDLEPARLVHAGRDRRQGRHSAAGQVRRYFFPGVTHGGGRGGFSSAADGGQRLRAAGESCAERADAIRVDESARRMGDEGRGDAAEPISDDCRWHAGAEHGRGVGISGHSRKTFTRESRVRCSTTISGPSSTTRTPPACSRRRRRSNGRCPSSSSRSMRDGNEVAGVKSPLQTAPLGTYTGWNVTASGPLKGQVVRPRRRLHPVREDEG